MIYVQQENTAAWLQGRGQHLTTLLLVLGQFTDVQQLLLIYFIFTRILFMT